jgi:AmmeMemoRadiSam system protein B/AmmeMemoRadiSam system protein A
MSRKSLLPFLLLLIVACKNPVLEPSVAGSFYPAEKDVLESTVQGYLDSATDSGVDGRPIAIISPHAGYVFSGQVAAYGYKHLRNIDTVILIGSSHKKSFKGAAVFTTGAFRTPLGEVQVDRETGEKLLNYKINVDFKPDVFRNEHSLEVQLPFLQTVLGDFKIVPVLIGVPNVNMYQHLATTIAGIMSENRNVLVVASTDLSHYHNYDTAVKMDQTAVAAIKNMWGPKVQTLLSNRKVEMCAAPAVLLTMEVAKRLGANQVVLYKYANSGDVTGNREKVVGYASMGFYNIPLTDFEKRRLLLIARKAIVEKVRYGKASEIDTDEPKLQAYGAVFVTIKIGGRLRGCIGHLRPVMPLYMSVLNNAVAASSYDNRFPPMKTYELEGMELEISILSRLEPIKNISEIKVGKHGLFLVKDKNAGLLLPQVATENGWDRNTFLRQVSKKAGLPPDAWSKDSDIYTFEAEIIKESDYGPGS